MWTGQNTGYCLIWCTVDDSWTYPSTDNGLCVLKFVADLATTTPEHQTAPEYLNDVTLRIDSEENKIRPVSKLQSRIRLWNEIHRSRSVCFQWDLTTVVEMKEQSPKHSTPSCLTPSNQEYRVVDNTPSNNYPAQTFVAVRSSRSAWSSTSMFWIGEVLHSFWGRSNNITSLRILCYSMLNDKCNFTGKYQPWTLKGPRGTLVDWIDRVDTDSVLTHFKSLARMMQLPANVANHLRSARWSVMWQIVYRVLVSPIFKTQSQPHYCFWLVLL